MKLSHYEIKKLKYEIKVIIMKLSHYEIKKLKYEIQFIIMI